MNRTQGWMLRAASAALLPSLLLAPLARAQQPQADGLDALLAGLHAADGKAWQARTAAMQAAADKARADAAALRKQAGSRDQAAAAEQAEAKRLRAEIDKLEQLRAAIAAMTFVDPAGGEQTKSSDQGALEIALAGLRKLPKAAWDARGGAMRTKAAAHDERAATLHQERDQLLASATAKDAEAKQLDAERGKLAELQKLVGALEIKVITMLAPAKAEDGPAAAATGEGGKPAGDAAAKDGAMKDAGKPAPTAKASSEKAPAKQDAAKPAMAKKEPAKQSTAKKDAAKKDAPKKDAAKEPAKPAPAMKAAAKKEPAKKKPAKNAPKKEPKAKDAKKPTPQTAAANNATPRSPAADASPKPAPKQPSPMAAAATSPEGGPKLLTYEDHVYPIFDEYCIGCHDQGDASGGLDLSTHASTLQGGSSGRTLRPGAPDDSRLYLLVSHKEKPTMPPKEPRIDGALIDTIRTWIAQGAPKDAAQASKLATARAKAQAKAAAEAKAREQAKVVVQATMPEDLPRVQKNYPPRPGAMRAIAASPGAPLLAAPGFGQVLLLHQDDLRELGVLPFGFGQVESLAFSADATRLVAAGGTPGKSGGAALYDVRTGEELGRFGERKDAALTAAVSPRGDLVAVGGTRRRVQVFRAADGEVLWRHQHDDWVTAVAFSPDGKLLASADRQGMVVVREAANGREVHDFKAADGIVAALAFSPDSASLATAGSDRSVCLFRMRDGRRLFRQTTHSDQVLCLTWRSATRIVSSGADGRVITWKTNGSRDPELPRVADWVYGVAASGDGKLVFTADWRGRVVAFDVKSRKALGTLTPLALTQN